MFAWLTRLQNRLHRFHDWRYGPRTGAGWGIVTCRICGRWDIY